jgi:hypothetical protein
MDDRRAMQLCAWCAPALIVVMGIGLVGFAGLVPPPSPGDSAETIQRMFVEHQGGIRIGMVLVMIASAGFIPWTTGLAHLLKRTGHGSPALTHIQTASGVIACLVGVNFSMITSLAAFRPSEVAAETTRLLDDLMWFWWLIPWPPFMVWCVLVGVLILKDRSPGGPRFPRWLGYLSIWAAVCYTPGSLAIFFKGGPFAYDSLIVWYIPTVVFFIWMVVMTVFMLKDAKRPDVVVDRPEALRA